MDQPPFDQRLARVLVRPLARTPLTPNQMTTITVVLAFLGAGLIGVGHGPAIHWGAGIFALARFLDHFDGELARQTGRASRFGYFYDYAAGASSYAALFVGLGVAFRDGWLGQWSIALGAVGAASAFLSMALNLDIDKREGQGAANYPGFAGFELEDGIYLIAPIVWLGWAEPFFIGAGAGAGLYGLWTVVNWLGALRRGRR
ncbi:MAG: CDP-alcohol phosphatidyltransferase family protein [Rhodospirillales bacterium]